jgi:hypothetical protein
MILTNHRVGPIVLVTILVMSIPVLIISVSAAADDAPSDVAISAIEESGDGEVSAASGANRFTVWADQSSNSEIFFKRSTDNGATWLATINLSANPGFSDKPAIAVSGSKVYVVWRQQNLDFDVPLSDIFFRRSLDNGATWGPKVKISSEGMTWFSAPTVAATGDNVYILWSDSIDHPDFCDSRSCTSDGPVYLRRSANSGQTWAAIKELGTSDRSLYQLAVVGANVYVIWGRAADNGETFYSDSHLRFVRSTDNGATWKAPIILQSRVNPNDCEAPGVECFGNEIAGVELAASGANVHAIWTRVTCGLGDCESEVLLRRSTDGGATWKSVRNLSNNAGNSLVQDLAVSGSNVYALWTDDTPGNEDVFFRRSIDNGATWQTVKNLSNNAGQSEFADMVVSGANLYIAWSQQNTAQTQVDILLKRSTDNGVTWKPAVNISNMNSGDSTFPQVAVSGSSVFVVWQDDTPGNNDILFRRSIDSGNTWQTIKNLSNNSGPSREPDIAL